MSELPSIEEKAIELIEKFEALAVDIAPDAIELGMMAARVAAAEGTVGFLVLACISLYMFRKARTAWPGAEWEGDGSPENIDALKLLLCGGVGTASGIVAALMFSVWPFVGIFYPELWIAKQVLGW